MTETGISVAHLGPIMARGLGDDVYDALLDMLTAGDLEPDSPLAIDRLAKSLSVSPTPVREALARLEHTGLVRRVANRGYRVAPPMSAQQMTELVDARLVLEAGALERAMDNIDEFLPDLELAFKEHAEAAAALTSDDALKDLAKVHAYYEYDWAFHQAVLDNCGNRYINRAVNEMSFSVHRMRQTIGRHMTDAPIAIREHSRILAAVRSRDKEAAVAAMTAHLQKVATRSTE